MLTGRPTRRRFLHVSGAVAAALAAGPPARAAAALPVIRWGLFRNYQPVYAGLAAGLFEQAGVRVVSAGSFTSGPAVIQAAATGQIDAGHAAITALANAAAQGFKLTGVADSQTEFADAPLQQWLVTAPSPRRTMADLRGARIGTNSLSGSFYYTVLLALRRQRIARDAVRFVILPHERQEQALRAGLIDVAGIVDPYTIAALHRGGVRTLFTGADVLGQRQISLVFFTRQFADAHPDTVRRFLAGYRQAIALLAAPSGAGNRAMAQALDLDPQLVVPHRYTDGAQVILPDAAFWLATMRAAGDLADAPRLTAAAFATDRFNA